ncbi:MAG: hypothetical protein LUC24_03970 [Bacteroidales bacterium]|nr:hypothetical protein [Bacteroidales bacterium]
MKSPDQVQLDSIVTRYYDAKKAARNDLVTDDLYRDMQREVDAFFDSVEIRDWHYLLGELRLEDETPSSDHREVRFTLKSARWSHDRPIVFKATYKVRLDALDTDSTYLALKTVDNRSLCPVIFSGVITRDNDGSTFPKMYGKYDRERQIDSPTFNLTVTSLSIEPETASAPADTTSSIWEKIRKNIESRHVD